MSSAVQSPPQVRFDAETHRYYLGETRLHSVTSVLKAVWPIKKSFDGVSPEVLENARERGILVDKYCCEYARTGAVDIPPNERLDVIERVGCFVDWWDRQDVSVLAVDTQVILADPVNDIAGTADLVIGRGACIYDIKCTSQEEADWQYQLGAYGSMVQYVQSLAVIHINPRRYPKGGLRIIPYDTNESIRRWRNIVAFWSDCRPWLDEVQRKSQLKETA